MAERNENNKVTEIVKRFESSRDYKADFVSNCKDYYDQYLCKFQNIVEGRANIYVPLTRGVVDSEIPRFYAARPEIIYSAKLAQYRQFNPQVNAHHEDVWHDSRGTQAVMDMSQLSILFGMSGGYVPWVRRARKVRELKPYEVFGIPLPLYHQVEAEKITYEGPKLVPLPLWRMFWDRGGIDVDSCGWMGHVEPVSALMIRRALSEKFWTPKGKAKAKIDELIEKADKWDRFFVFYYFEDEYACQLLYPYKVSEKDLVEKKYQHLDVDTYQNIKAEKGGLIPVSDVDFPFSDGRKPYLVGRNTPLVQEMMAIGEPEKLRMQQQEWNIIRSVRLDNANAGINRMWIAKRDSQIDPNDLIFKPNGVIWVKGQGPLDDHIKELHTSDISGTGVQEEGAIHRDAMYAVGQTDTRLGAESMRNERTATALLQANEGGDMRIQQKIENFNLGVYEPLGDMFLARARQFITEDREFSMDKDRRNPGDWKVGPRELAPEYKTNVRGRRTNPLNRQARITEITSFLNILRLFPPLGERYNPDGIADEIDERFDFDEIPGFRFTPEEIQQRRQQAQQLNQRLQQGQSVGGREMMQLVAGGRR